MAGGRGRPDQQIMAPGCVNILMHHGGAFTKQDELTYDGGDITLFQKIDKDELSYYHLVQLAKTVGFKDDDNLYYAIPGRSLDEGGIDYLKDDSSISEMMKYANGVKFLEVYIQHNYANVSGYPAVGDAAQQDYTDEFTYALAGWEGSAADARVLRDALARPNGLKVPHGCYYLVDAGYKNCDGFLAPYRGQRYHLKEWSNPPTKKEELFNMRHSSARNVIEITFGLLKLRWGIIRNGSYYPIDTQNGIILACCYLHNLI